MVLVFLPPGEDLPSVSVMSASVDRGLLRGFLTPLGGPGVLPSGLSGKLAIPGL